MERTAYWPKMSLVPAAVADVSVTPADSHLQYHFIQLKTSKVIKMNNEQDWGCRPKHSIMWWGCDICRFASSRWWWYTLTDNYKFLHSSLRNIHPLLQLPASCLCSGVSEEKQKYSNKKLTPHLLFFCPAAAELRVVVLIGPETVQCYYYPPTMGDSRI